MLKKLNKLLNYFINKLIVQQTKKGESLVGGGGGQKMGNRRYETDFVNKLMEEDTHYLSCSY